jgi:hypothetical protein
MMKLGLLEPLPAN